MDLINAKLHEEYLQARRGSLTDTLTGVGSLSHKARPDGRAL